MADRGWNFGAWFGTLGGATLYIGGIGIEIAVRSDRWTAAGYCWAVFGLMLALGVILWSERHRVASAVAYQVVIWAGAVAGIAAFALREVAGLPDYRLGQIWWLFLIFPALSAQMYFIDKKLQQAPPEG